MSAQQKNFFFELTGIRAIAAYMVFFHHNNMFSEKKFGWFIHNFINELHVGVTIFFVLSGFLICHRYYDNIELHKKKWIFIYIKNRVARIYPMYFLMTTITFIFIFKNSVDIKNDIIIYIMNITFLRGFFQSIAFTGIAQGWTLTVEECFYISAPFLFAASKKIKLIIPFLLIFFSGTLLVLIFRKIDFHGFFADYKFMLSYTFFGRCFEFFIGVSLALYLKRKTKFNKANSSFYTNLGSIWITLCIASFVLIKEDEKFGVFRYEGILINNLVLPIGIAMLFLGLVTERSWFGRILSSRLFVLLGKSSYIFYLIHMSLVSLFINEFFNNTIILFILLNLLSIVMFKYLEEPMNKYIRNLKFG
ncbi:MAG: acyltransferase [Chitinophagales bacterium]